MSESLHEMAARMCRGRCGYDCTGCPVRTEIKGLPCLISSLFYTDNADEQIEVLKRWAEEHPKKTWLDLLRKKLPDSAYARDHNKIPKQCPHTLLGGEAPGVNNRCGTGCMIDISCWECWNREVEE